MSSSSSTFPRFLPNYLRQGSSRSTDHWPFGSSSTYAIPLDLDVEFTYEEDRFRVVGSKTSLDFLGLFNETEDSGFVSPCEISEQDTIQLALDLEEEYRRRRQVPEEELIISLSKIPSWVLQRNNLKRIMPTSDKGVQTSFEQSFCPPTMDPKVQEILDNLSLTREEVDFALTALDSNFRVKCQPSEDDFYEDLMRIDRTVKTYRFRNRKKQRVS